MRILTAEAMAAVDRRAIEEVGIPGPVLMENAAIGLADAVGELYPEAEAVAIFCGPGNNGGDGLALARHLDGRGYEVAAFLAAFGKTLSEDCAAQLAILRHHAGVEIVELGEDDDLAPALAAAREHDLVVDALFGTGLVRALDGRFAELVEGINELPPPVVAVDLPSGLAGSSAEVPGPCVDADATVTFAAPKIAHVFPPAAGAVGELVVADLGLPPHLVEEAEGDLHLVRPEDLAGLLPEREPASHKGDYGHALVLAGSTGKAGAAALAARAAVRAGAGLVTAAVPAPIAAIVAGASLESMTVALPAGEGGEIAEAAAEAVLAACAGKDALAAGPGLGRRPETAAAIRTLALRCPLPLVLDADAVVAFAGRATELQERPEGAGTVLTPHPGELGALLGIAAAEVQADRPAAARRAAAETGAVVVLKGHLTLIAEPGGPMWVNPTGNPGMATGGTGDVLTGMVAALLARLGDPAAAARLAVWLHGAAGDAAAAARGEESLAAGDLLDHLPAAFAALAGG